MAVTCKWAVGYELNVATVTTDTTNVSDGTNDTAPYDTSTYVQDGTGGVSRKITIIWDLGVASTVTRIRYNAYYSDGPSYSLEASNDGTTWVTVFTAYPAGWAPHFGGSWESIDSSDITSTQYRYWRYSLQDTNDNGMEIIARCGDFRLYNGSTQYEIGGSSGQTITVASGIASVAAFGTHTLTKPYVLKNLQSLTGIGTIKFAP